MYMEDKKLYYRQGYDNHQICRWYYSIQKLNRDGISIEATTDFNAIASAALCWVRKHNFRNRRKTTIWRGSECVQRARPDTWFQGLAMIWLSAVLDLRCTVVDLSFITFLFQYADTIIFLRNGTTSVAREFWNDCMCCTIFDERGRKVSGTPFLAFMTWSQGLEVHCNLIRVSPARLRIGMTSEARHFWRTYISYLSASFGWEWINDANGMRKCHL